MILWKDFNLSDELGPSLIFEEQEVCRTAEDGGSSVMEDTRDRLVSKIQETGQEIRPARMVGLTSLDSTQPGMDAGRDRRPQIRQEEGGGGA